MAVHYFHCTDGVDLIVDRRGREASGRRELARYARETAEAVMRAVPSYDAWECWAVYVYGERGQLAIVPFLPDPDEEVRFAALPEEAEGPPAPTPPAMSRPDARAALAVPVA